MGSHFFTEQETEITCILPEMDAEGRPLWDRRLMDCVLKKNFSKSLK